ncbi:MAG TPA: recombinase RecA, partial [Candidatus Angelobacter sp.]|nr:recombinase RecA [Candidatus Angelobacter sp.]
ILQAGGFACIVLDLAGLSPEAVSAIDLSTWHRYRVAAERTQSSILLLSQYACAKSSSALQLRLGPAKDISDEATVFTGIEPNIQVSRHRFTQPEAAVVSIRKLPQRETGARWQSRTPWAGAR